MKTNTILTIVNLIIIFLVLWLCWSVIKTGIAKVERIECNQWAEDAKRYPDFYYTEWQANQCGIKYQLEE